MCFTNVIAQGFKKKKKKEKICEKEANNEFKDTHKTRKFKEGSSKWFSSINMGRSKGNDLRIPLISLHIPKAKFIPH